MNDDVMTPTQFEQAMKAALRSPQADTEQEHIAADALMCKVLKSLGYGAGVKRFRRADKWYS